MSLSYSNPVRVVKEVDVPFKKRIDDAGFDLYCVGVHSSSDEKTHSTHSVTTFDVTGKLKQVSTAIVIHPHQTIPLKTGIKVAMPYKFYGKIESRSSCAKKGLVTVGGVIDASYRGEIIVLIHNNTPVLQTIHTGDRVAQIVFHCIPQVDVTVVQSLDETDRGEGGFGSTGK